MKTVIIGYETENFSGPTVMLSGPEKSAENRARFVEMKRTNNFPAGVRSAELWCLHPAGREAWIAPKTEQPQKKKEKK